MTRSSTTFGNLAALGLPAAYLVLEFSFNHRLMSLTADMVDEQVLQGLEFWGRLLSGIGFGLLMFRIARGWMGPSQGVGALLVRLALSIVFGIVLMWNVQKWITSHWVSTATEDDKKVALVLGALAGQAAQGQLTTLGGGALVQGQPKAAEAQLTAALFPAASLYADQRALQLATWKTTLQASARPVMPVGWTLPPAMTQAQLDNGFRNLIIPPLTLGFSLFFALVNVAQLAVNLTPALSERSRRWAATGVLAVLVAVSASHASPFLDSPGYQQSLQANLWAGDRALALLTEWSFRSVSLWQPVSQWLHGQVLQDFAFRKPY